MISVIVPVLNEQQQLPRFLKSATRWSATCDVVFSDGESTDATSRLLDGENVVCGPAGRGAQLQRGAQKATGDAFLFLHADSRIEPNTIENIEKVLSRGARWGCLHMRFDNASMPYRVGAFLSNARVALTGIPFGDQGIFITRHAFEQIGGYPEIALMEDYELSRRARKAFGRPARLADHIETSARRFEESGALQCAWEMRVLRHRYRRGVPIERIAAAYPNTRETESQSE